MLLYHKTSLIKTRWMIYSGQELLLQEIQQIQELVLFSISWLSLVLVYKLSLLQGVL